MTTRTLLIGMAAFALLGCKKKDEDAGVHEKPVFLDAAPKPAPPPAHAFELTVADEASTRPVQSRALVILGKDGAITVTAAPTTMEPPGMIGLDALPPGEVVTLADLPAKTAAIYNDHPLPAPEGVPDGTIPVASTEPCLHSRYGMSISGYGVGNGRGGEGYGVGTDSRRRHAGLRGAALTSETPCADAPLVLADARATASQLLEVLVTLPYAMLGVTTDGGAHARPLRIAMTYEAGTVPAEPTLEVGFVVRADRVDGVAYRGATPDESVWSWHGDVNGLGDAWHAGQAKDGLGATWVRVRIDGELTAGALITALTKLVAANVEGVAIGEPIDLLRGGMRGNRGDVPLVKLPQATISSAYDKQIVRRYLKRNLPKFRYCYEKELLTDAKLAGTITATFQIELTGKVSGAKADGVSKTVSSCYAGVFESIEFPKPADGVPAKVTQSFELTATGG